jgi:hypothetical protein
VERGGVQGGKGARSQNPGASRAYGRVGVWAKRRIEGSGVVDIVDRVDPMDTRHLAILGSTLSAGSTSSTDVSLAAPPFSPPHLLAPGSFP